MGRDASPTPPPSLAPAQARAIRLAKARRGAHARPAADAVEICDAWGSVGPSIAFVVLALGVTRVGPLRPEGLIMAIVAVMICLSAGWFSRLEAKAKAQSLVRPLSIGLAVGLPMLLVGEALAGPAHSAAAPALAALLGLTLAVAIALAGRLPVFCLAEMALWTGFFARGLANALVAVLIAGGAIAAGAAYRRARAIARYPDDTQDERHWRADDLLQGLENGGQNWFWEADRHGTLTYISASVAERMGCEPKHLRGTALFDLVQIKASVNELRKGLQFFWISRSAFHDVEVGLVGDKGSSWLLAGWPIYDGWQNFLGFRGSASNLSEKRRLEQFASRMAKFDSLTGLLNRYQIAQRLDNILTSPVAESRICAVMLIDLDRFKQVNDTMGHPAGDALLKQVARRLHAVVGEGGRVGRLGGDEFQVIIPGHHSRAALAALAEQIITTLSQPYTVEASRVVIGASVGVAVAPDDGDSGDALIRNADLALYAAKDRGRGVYHFYDADLHSHAQEKRQLEVDLREALVSGGLELHYQPVVQAASERITGFEALIRWNHPTRGPLEPSKFIPLAEDTGLIAQIGEWALRTACRDLAQWPEGVRVAVNVSPLQFASGSLPVIITSALANAGVAAGRLELELTESVFLSDDEGTDALFKALKRIGVRLALDDFGTGYSALGYLKTAPFDRIKIDRSFVSGATQGQSRNAAIIAAIVSMADALGMETTAEGVEMHDQLELMRELGCSHIQGFIYAAPMSAAAATARLADGLSITAVGPRATRATRRNLLRRAVVAYDEARYDVIIRNLSETGALLEGVWNVPEGSEMEIMPADDLVVFGAVRWSQHGRVGVKFARSLSPEEYQRLVGGRGVATPGFAARAPRPGSGDRRQARC